MFQYLCSKRHGTLMLSVVWITQSILLSRKTTDKPRAHNLNQAVNSQLAIGTGRMKCNKCEMECGNSSNDVQLFSRHLSASANIDHLFSAMHRQQHYLISSADTSGKRHLYIQERNPDPKNYLEFLVLTLHCVTVMCTHSHAPCTFKAWLKPALLCRNQCGEMIRMI